MIFPLSSFMNYAVATGVLGLGLDAYGNSKKAHLEEEGKEGHESGKLSRANVTIIFGRLLETAPALWAAAAIAELASPVIGGIAISGAIILGLTHIVSPYFSSSFSQGWSKAAHSIAQYINAFVITAKVALVAHPAVAVGTFLAVAIAASRT